MTIARFGDFDAVALYVAMDERRESRGLSWNQVAGELDGLSRELNEKMARAGHPNHPVAASTIKNMLNRKDTTCQHGRTC